ncbi:MAG: CCA tRNA nucleotidyltransferase [Planctomycetes bacterium]|nr:CCA tRNA nucleotidyltransferase [Planctomycetota bacterium]
MANQRQLAESVIRTLRGAGHEALLAGGCVRDLLLGRPARDYDVATAARPEQVLALYPRALTVGQAFGVVVVTDGAAQVEVATFRADAGYSDGRHPDAVTFTTAADDARRRDFTINAMFLDPESDTVTDDVGGRADLEARVIRAVGDPRVRFAEDRLRMLRAVRFAAELGFEIEPATASAARDLAATIGSVSGERVAAELAKILTAPPGGRRRGLELADAFGLLAVLLPEVHALHGVEQGPHVHPEGDVFVHTVLCVERLREPSFELALAALLHDLGKPATARQRDGRWTFYGHARLGEKMAVAVCRRLHLSTLRVRRVGWLVRHHMHLADAANMREARLKRLFATDGFEELAELWRADCLASGGTADAYEDLMARYRALGHEAVRPAPLVTGHDLVGLGLEPGPAFRDILDAVYDAQLEGLAPGRDDALALARRLIQERCPNQP